MLSEVLVWWATQMRDLLPDGMANRKFPGRSNAVIVTHGADRDDQFLVSLRRNGRETPLGCMALDESGVAAGRRLVERHARSAVVVRTKPGVLLERAVVLPLAAERDPERVLRYEMDRLTPFRSDEIFWSWAILERDRARERLVLRLSLVPKTQILPLLDVAASLLLTPTIVEAAGADGVFRAITPVSSRLQRAHSHRRATLALGGACAVLALTAVALPFARQHLTDESVSARIATLRPLVAQVEAMRHNIADDTGGKDAIATEHARAGDALEVIAALTDILTDSTFLTDLTLHQGKLALSGQSAAAAQLIAALAADPTIRNPAFAAPVTRADGDQADLFSLRAELSP